MHRGSMYLILGKDEVIKGSHEFNGDMGLDRYGAEVLSEMAKVQTKADFAYFLTAFDQKYFQYGGVKPIKHLSVEDARKEMIEAGEKWKSVYECLYAPSVLDFAHDAAGRNELMMSDSNYFKNISSETVTLIFENEDIELAPGEMAVSYYRKYLAKGKDTEDLRQRAWERKTEIM